MPSILDATSPEEFDRASRAWTSWRKEEEPEEALKADQISASGGIEDLQNIIESPGGQAVIRTGQQIAFACLQLAVPTTLLELLAAKGRHGGAHYWLQRRKAHLNMALNVWLEGQRPSAFQGPNVQGLCSQHFLAGLAIPSKDWFAADVYRHKAQGHWRKRRATS